MINLYVGFSNRIFRAMCSGLVLWTIGVTCGVSSPVASLDDPNPGPDACSVIVWKDCPVGGKTCADSECEWIDDNKDNMEQDNEWRCTSVGYYDQKEQYASDSRRANANDEDAYLGEEQNVTTDCYVIFGCRVDACVLVTQVGGGKKWMCGDKYGDQPQSKKTMDAVRLNGAVCRGGQVSGGGDPIPKVNPGLPGPGGM
jgi:hypothetical protein